MPYAISTEPLVQMLQSIALQKRTGLLRVEQFGDNGREQGEVYFEGGRPMRAQVGLDSGKIALKRISAWKHITCSFESVNRPYPGLLPSLTSSNEASAGKDFLASMSPSTQSLTASQQYTPLPMPLLQETGPQRIPGTFPARSPRSSATEPVSTASVNLRASISEGPVTQSFLTSGDHQKDVSQKTRSSDTPHASQHLASRPFPAMLSTLPVTPLPVNDSLPGRMAIFKPVAMVNSAKSIQRLERRDRVIFLLLDGSRTIRDIAQLMHYSEGEVEQILVRLTRYGYTERVLGRRLLSYTQEKG